MKIRSKFLRALFNRCCGRFIFNSLYREIVGDRFLLTLSFDMDLKKDHEALPKLLDLSTSYPEIRFDLAVVGKWVEKYTKLYKKAVDLGHGLINHTYSHPNSEEFNPKKWKELKKREQFEEIKKCHEIVKELVGYGMKGFRLPHFGSQFTEDIYPMLKELNYVFSSSLLAIDAKKPVPYKTHWGIIEFPIAICPKHPFIAFDSYHSLRKRWHSEKEFYSAFDFLVEFFREKKLHLNLYFDLEDVDVERIKDKLMLGGSLYKVKEVDLLLK